MAIAWTRQVLTSAAREAFGALATARIAIARTHIATNGIGVGSIVGGWH